MIWSGLRGRELFEKRLPLMSPSKKRATIQCMYPFGRVNQDRSRQLAAVTESSRTIYQALLVGFNIDMGVIDGPGIISSHICLVQV